MLREFNERRPSFEAMLRSYALQILIAVLRDADRTAALEGAPRGGVSARLRTAMEYIHLHYDDNALTVEDVAEWVKYSPNYLTSLFSRAMGLSVYQYIVYVRIENAKRLISMGSMTIGDIATAVGYSSVYVFCRSFKQSVGMSATEYAASQRA
jgi:two-component system response regulator YesN